MAESEQSLYRSVGGACLGVHTGEDFEKAKEIIALFRFGEDFPGYQGHFPDNPVLPAIVQLAAVRYVVESFINEKLSVTKYERIKFRGVITPGGDTRIMIRLAQREGSWTADFSVANDKGESVADGKCFLSTR